MAEGFEEFEPIFGKIKADWDKPSANPPPLLPFLFHVHALDASRLRLHVTDFHSYTWEAIRSTQQLEDLRDDIGVGGSWSEFVDYLIASIKSEDVKLVLIASTKSAFDSGATFAKLVARKTKGMPLITISLDRIMDSYASDAMANLSLELFKAFKGKQDLAVKVSLLKFVLALVNTLLDSSGSNKEQERSYQLTKSLSAEQEKNDSIQNQLDTALFSRKQKLKKMTTSDKTFPIASLIGSLDTPVPDLHVSPQNPHTEDSLTTKVGRRVVPAYRRAKVRGVLLDDTEDGGDK